MSNCLYFITLFDILTLSVCEFVVLCIVNILYFFNVLCNCVRVCNIVDWLFSLEWGWVGPSNMGAWGNLGPGVGYLV